MHRWFAHPLTNGKLILFHHIFCHPKPIGCACRPKPIHDFSICYAKREEVEVWQAFSHVQYSHGNYSHPSVGESQRENWGRAASTLGLHPELVWKLWTPIILSQIFASTFGGFEFFRRFDLWKNKWHWVPWHIFSGWRRWHLWSSHIRQARSLLMPF